MTPPRTRRFRNAEAAAALVADEGSVGTAGMAPIDIDTVDAATITADEFWKTFVSKRRPALIRGLLRADPSFRQLERWKDDAHLVACAGDEQVEVEKGAMREVAAAAGPSVASSAAPTRANGRHPNAAAAAAAQPPPGQQRVLFGLGDRTRMTLRDFLERRARGEPLYLSTQAHPRAPEDGAPDLHAAPLRGTALCGEAPLVPPLLAPLVPQAINVWIGPAAASAAAPAPGGSTSGLHHDYHDNLYLLLRGAKRFRLWPPSALEGLYPHGGRPAAVHASGRIVYGGGSAGAGGGGKLGGPPVPCSVLPDGTDAAEAARWTRRWGAERAVAEAEGSARRREPGARRALRAAGAALEAALEADLDEQLGRRRRRGGGGSGGKEGGGGGSEEDEEEEESEFDGGEGGLDLLEGMRDDYDEMCGGDDDDGGDGGGGNGHGGPDDEDEDEGDGDGGIGPSPPPPSFSRVDLSPYPADADASPEAVRRADAEIRASFPLFPGLSSALSARVGEGDALFLPAGWFHEVTTRGGCGGVGGGGQGGVGSLALNYWFYPPDALDEEAPPLSEEEGGAAGASPAPAPSPSPSSPAPPPASHLRLRPLWPYRASGGFLAEVWRRRLEWLGPRHAAMRALAAAVARREAAGGGGGGSADRAAERRRERLRERAAAAAAKTPPGGGRSPLLQFHAGVSAPENRYRTSTTRPGSASGAPSAPPKLSAERRERLGLQPPPPPLLPDEEDDEDEEDEDDGDGAGTAGGGGDDGAKRGEAGGQAAFRAMLRANPDLARQLLARLAMQQQQQQGGRGGGGPAAGGAAALGRARRPTRAERAWMGRRELWLAHGRRHHLVAGRWRGRDWGWGGRRTAGCETRGEVEPSAARKRKRSEPAPPSPPQ